MTIWKSSPQLDSVFPLLETPLLLYFYWPKSILSCEPSLLFCSMEQKVNLSLVWKVFFTIFFGKHDFVASIDLGSLNDNESALKTHPYKHKFYCFVVPYSGVKYLFYLHPFSSKVYKNPFVQSITILICIGWTSPYDVPVTSLPSSPLPLLLVLFQLVS